MTESGEASGSMDMVDRGEASGSRDMANRGEASEGMDKADRGETNEGIDKADRIEVSGSRDNANRIEANERKQMSRFKRQAVKVEEAQQRLLAAADGLALGSELVPLRASGGRWLAQTIAATSDWPPFARSGLDGYAVRAADIASASPGTPATLRVVDSVAAGELALATVQKGTAVRIMTGAAVPMGADAVVMLEQTAEAMLADGSPAVLIKHAAAAGQHIAPQGEEFRLGGVLACPGTLVRPGHIALLATFGYAEVAVGKRPRVAIFATGSELLAVEAPLAAGQIRDSNSFMVAAMVEQSGGVAVMCGSLEDKPDAVEAALASVWDDVDLIVTTGGVSVGDFDVMSDIIRSIKNNSVSGSEDASRVFFDKVAMRPGSPTSAAMLNGKLLLALSGNPGACFVGFELFVRPVLLRLQGASEALPRKVKAKLRTAVNKPSPHDRFVRTTLISTEDGSLDADPLAYSKSSMMASIPDAEGLAIIPSGSRGAEAGDIIEVVLIP